ncbi:MAG TPA: hypothetical protein VFS33_07240 [Gemmatimonadales bacterium]|nr:hypothetical protein [Gemmatimonadales bacterium]
MAVSAVVGAVLLVAACSDGSTDPGSSMDVGGNWNLMATLGNSGLGTCNYDGTISGSPANRIGGNVNRNFVEQGATILLSGVLAAQPVARALPSPGSNQARGSPGLVASGEVSALGVPWILRHHQTRLQPLRRRRLQLSPDRYWRRQAVGETAV